MGKRRAYRSTAVKKIVLEKVLESAPAGDVLIGMDVGKADFFAVLRWSDGTFERPTKSKTGKDAKMSYPERTRQNAASIPHLL